MELLVVSVSAECGEIVADVLRESGAWAVEERSATDSAEPACELRASMGAPSGAVVERALARIADIDPSTRWRWERVDESVLGTWRDFAEVREVAQGWSIVPAWRPDLGHLVDPHRAILIEPGTTFGMGDHPTTIAMLRAIDRTCRASPGTPRTLVDAGCGSGILAVYAARVHGLESRCFDIAPDAEAATAHNARVNGVGDLVTFVADQVLIEDGWARIVAANIGAAALVALQPSLLRMVAPGGAVFLGGIRSHQVDDVLAAFGPAGVSSVETIDGWCTVTVSPSPTLTRTMWLTEGAGAE